MDVIANDLVSFVEIVTQNNQEQFYHSTAHLQWAYRGQANVEWELLPSAFRNREDFLNENLYLRECMREMPNELQGNDYFDILVKAQHYGIPTRLLDVTKNPLVALYFACIGEKEKDGCVYIFDKIAVFPQDEPVFQIIMQYLFELKIYDRWYPQHTVALTRLLEKQIHRHPALTSEKIEEALKRQPSLLFTFPKISNDRIRAQQGGFAVFNTRLEYKKEGTSIQGRFWMPDEEWSGSNNRWSKIIIPANRKDDFLRDLNLLGINQSVLFPELEKHAQYIVNNIRETNRAINDRVAKKEIDA